MIQLRSDGIDHILTLLIAERDKLNRAIEVLQGTKRRPGRPRKNPEAVLLPSLTSPPTDGRRRGMSVTARQEQSKRMKAYWQKRRKAASKKA